MGFRLGRRRRGSNIDQKTFLFFYLFIYSFSGCCFVCFLWLKILNLLLSLWHSQQQELEIRCQVYRLWTALASVCETSVWYVPISRWCTLSLRRKGVFKSLNAVEILTKKNIQQSSIFTSSCPQYHKIICSSHWPWSLFLRAKSVWVSTSREAVVCSVIIRHTQAV